jgi:phosphate starvation-inducible PhoH-like protein
MLAPLSSIIFIASTISCISRKIPSQPKLQKTKFLPMNQEQQHYIDYMNDKKTSITVCTGNSGSGKSLFAILHAVQELSSGNTEKIILTRPTVLVDGECYQASKIQPFTKPLFDILHEFYSKNEINHMVSDDIIEICPLGFMRGRTFKKSIIIADEMQNSTPEQMLMLTTRIGSQSKLILTGDLMQYDTQHRNGLSDLLDKLKTRNSKRIKNIELFEVLRSPIVSEILDIYNNVEQKTERHIISSHTKDKNEKYIYDLWD